MEVSISYFNNNKNIQPECINTVLFNEIIIGLIIINLVAIKYIADLKSWETVALTLTNCTIICYAFASNKYSELPNLHI